MVKMLAPRLRTVDTRSAKPPPKRADEHYLTPEHRAWRTEVIRRANGICQWRGCNRAEPRMFADHIIELEDGGQPLALSNGQCLCGSHHTLKTNEAKRARLSR